MYYPSHIHQLVDGADKNLQSIYEVTSFYKELYNILSLQCMRQIGPAKCDQESRDYLFAIFKKINRNQAPEMKLSDRDDQYVIADVAMRNVQFTDEQRERLFTPYTVDLNFLLCRQIVREMGEATNLRACGLEARKGDDGVEHIVVTMPKRLFKKQI
jgi:hypothetical protein